MGTILLPIRPEYVDRILAGEKKYEFRKRRPKKDIQKIVIYATSPVMRIVGEVTVLGLIEDSPSKIWRKTKNGAGISHAKFRGYFAGCRIAYAFHLGEACWFETPISLLDFGISTPPQSFIYIEKRL